MKRLLVCLLLSLALHALILCVPWQGLKFKTLAAAINPADGPQPVTVGLTDLPPQPLTASAAVSQPAESEAGIGLEVAGGLKPSRTYLDRLSLRIFKAWDYPLSARQAGHEGVAKVFFVLDSQGAVGECRIETSTGFAELA